MQYRVGKCGSCGATFKVPASFEGDKAKCKACEKGVVEVGPVQGSAEGSKGEPAPAPKTKSKARPAPPSRKPAPVKAAKAAESEELEEYVPSGKKKRSGPSMMEKLRAERAAAEAAAGKPVPAKKPGAARPKAAAGRPKSGAKRAGAGRSAARAGVAAGAAKPARRAGARTGASSRRRGGGGDEEGGGRRGRREPEKKKSPAPLIGGIVVLAAAGFGVWKFVLSGDDKPVQASDEQVAAGENPATDEPAETPTTDEPTGVEDPVSDDTDGAEDPAADAPVEDDTPAEDATPPEPGEPNLGPDLSDTAAFPRFGPPEGTSEEDWTKVQEYIDTALDPMAGAAGNRALDKAIAMQKAGFAAIVNRMLDIDYTTEQGYRDGDILQRALEKIANGRNAGWKYSTEEADVRFNRKAVALLHGVWNRAKGDEAYWLFYTKQDKAEEEAVEEALSDDDLDDLDDLDGF